MLGWWNFVTYDHILLCWREENHRDVVDGEINLLNRSLKCTSQVYFQRKQITSYLTQNVNFLSFEILGVPCSDYEVCCLEEGRSRILIAVYRHFRGFVASITSYPNGSINRTLRNDSALSDVTLQLASRIRTELVLSCSCSQVVSKAVWYIPLLCVQWKTPDDGQRNCPKHIEFYSKNKFLKLVRLVGFIIRIYHDARSPERGTSFLSVFCFLPFAGKRTQTKLKLSLCTHQKSIWGSEDNPPRILLWNIVGSWIVRFTPYWASEFVCRRNCGLQNWSGFYEKLLPLPGTE